MVSSKARCSGRRHSERSRGIASQFYQEKQELNGRLQSFQHECSVCLEDTRTDNLLMFFPCGHAKVCVDCGRNVQACPICTAVVFQWTRLFSLNVRTHTCIASSSSLIAFHCLHSVKMIPSLSLKAFADSHVVLEAQRSQAKCSVCQEFYGNGWMGRRAHRQTSYLREN